MEVKYSRTGRRHVLAARSVSPGEVLLSIPIECLIFDSMYTEDNLLKEIQRKSNPRIALAFLIAAELKNANSTLQPFLSSIPFRPLNFLAFYTDADFKIAKGSMLMCILFFMFY